MNRNTNLLSWPDDTELDGDPVRWRLKGAAPGPIVFVVDHDTLLRRTVRQMLLSIGLAVEECATAESFLERYHPTLWGCLLLEVRLPGMSGLDLQDVLREAKSMLPIIMVTGFADVPTAVRALKGGAIDFLQKPFGSQLVLERIQGAVEISSQEHQLRAQRREILERFRRLSPRERQVMHLVTSGWANKEIAAATGTSPRTIEVHRASVMAKIGARSQADLIRFALEAGRVESLAPAGLAERPHALLPQATVRRAV